jgi:hypothetical protein
MVLVRTGKGVFNILRINKNRNLTNTWTLSDSTFEGESCDPRNPGDDVEDTPYQEIATAATCDPTQDTCPNSPGLDRKSLLNDYASSLINT